MRKSPVRWWPTWLLMLIIVGAYAQAGELNFGSPLVFGEVAKFEGGRETSVRKLSRGQLQALTLWLGLHRSAWRGISTPASNAQRLLRLNLKDAGGKSASLDAVVRAEGGLLAPHEFGYMVLQIVWGPGQGRGGRSAAL